LVVPQVAYTFWIVLGLAAGYSVGEYSTDRAYGAAGGRRQPLLTRIALGATILFVIGSVPIRARREMSEIDLSRVSYGIIEWKTTADGVHLRRTGPRATFFVRSSVRAIEVPLAPDVGTPPTGVVVDIVVDGHPADRVRLNGGGGRAVRINAPRSKRRYWRVDLYVAPILITRAVSRSSDAQEIGVDVGEISVKQRQDDAGKLY
jgi:hypothetical protein